MRIVIASLVGMVILFVYQALSWSVSPIHKNTFGYSKDQDAIVAFLSQHLHEDEIYYMPSPPPGASMQEHEDMMKSMVGKPYALVNYHNSMSGNMTSAYITGLLLNLACVLLIVLLMSRAAIAFTTFGSRLRLVMTFSVFLVLAAPMMTMNWWGYPWHYVMGDITDMLLGWFCCGLWLAWYMGRAKKAA